MINNQRGSPRLPIRLDVEFEHQDTGVLSLLTKDISDTGIFVLIEPSQHPPVGTTAKVKLKNNFEDGEEPPTLIMRVVRATDDGLGLAFIL